MPITREAVCPSCGNDFESPFKRGAYQKYCPTCLDERQRKPSVIQERLSLFGPVLVKIESLPGEWHEFALKNSPEPSYVIDTSGARYGVRWSGRIVIRADKAWQPGDVVLFEEVEAQHKVLSVAYTRHWMTEDDEPRERRASVGVPPALKDETAEVLRWVTTEVHKTFPDATVSDIEVEAETIETRRYVRLDAVAGIEDPDDEQYESLPRLVFTQAPYKTTLRGIGRQYGYKLSGSPLWAQEISGSVRSGRMGSRAMLALVDDEHPLEQELAFSH